MLKIPNQTVLALQKKHTFAALALSVKMSNKMSKKQIPDAELTEDQLKAKQAKEAKEAKEIKKIADMFRELEQMKSGIGTMADSIQVVKNADDAKQFVKQMAESNAKEEKVEVDEEEIALKRELKRKQKELNALRNQWREKANEEKKTKELERKAQTLTQAAQAADLPEALPPEQQVPDPAAPGPKLGLLIGASKAASRFMALGGSRLNPSQMGANQAHQGANTVPTSPTSPQSPASPTTSATLPSVPRAARLLQSAVASTKSMQEMRSKLAPGPDQLERSRTSPVPFGDQGAQPRDQMVKSPLLSRDQMNKSPQPFESTPLQSPSERTTAAMKSLLSLSAKRNKE